MPTLLVLAHLLTTALAADDPSLPDGYRHLTNTPRSVTNLNVETIRGLAFDPTLPRLYALNTHGSRLVFYDQNGIVAGGITKPTASFPTVNNPSAFALWDDTSISRRFAIVVGGGTHGVVKQDRDTGEIVAYLQLPSEPMDIQIDTELNRAYVSCAGAFDNITGTVGNVVTVSGGVVMRIDLPGFNFAGGAPGALGAIFIDGVRPTFLNIELGQSSTTADNYLLVAPFLSANNTTHQLQNGNAFQDEEVVAITGLPDDDLFRIDIHGPTPIVASVLRGAGTLLTAHQRNPITKQYWVLNVEELNAAHHTEPEHKGIFAENRVTIANDIALPQPAPSFVVANLVSLDGSSAAVAPLHIPGSTAPVDKPASFPFGLDFLPSTGYAFVVSSTGDILRILDAQGTTLRNVELPAGSIPRGVRLSADGTFLAVYAWGLNKVFLYGVGSLFFGSSAAPITTFDLGVDPTPPAVKHGRELWYDADNSSGTVTCNTCHPRGAADGLGWDLGDPPLDRKDTMVTQSLLGIEETFPYHWRGERTLRQFNPAFKGLLGGNELSESDFDDFQAFVFSLSPPANPRQSLDRVLNSNSVVRYANPTGGQVVGSGPAGQEAFEDVPDSLVGFLPVSCAQCHGGEVGTEGFITQDNATRLPTNGGLDVTHLRQMQHKFFQPKVTINPGPTQFQLPRSGFGFSQDGSDNDIQDFLNPGTFFPQFGTPNPTPAQLLHQLQLLADAATFCLQFDQGIAPRAHAGTMVDSGTSALAGNLMSQANLGWIDVVVIGRIRANVNAPFTPFAALFDPSTNSFRNASNQLSSYADLLNLHAATNLQALVLGLPPGNGVRFAFDPDDDGLSTLAENTLVFPSGLKLDPENRDTDGDGFTDGYEVSVGLDPTVNTPPALARTTDTTPPSVSSATTDFVGGRISKHFVTFSEPVKYMVQPERLVGTAFVPFGPLQMHAALCRADTLIAQGLLPSINSQGFTRPETFRLSVKMIDEAGNTNTQLVPVGVLQPRPTVFRSGVTPSLEVTQFQCTGVNPPTFNVTLTDTWAGATNGTVSAPMTAQNKVLVFQLVTKSGDTFSPVSKVNLSNSATTQVLSAFTVGTGIAQLRYPGNGLATNGDGPLILGPFILSIPIPTGSNSLTLTVNASVPVGTEAKLVFLGAFTPTSVNGNFDNSLNAFFWEPPLTDENLRAASFTF
jgi:hypothetical protein